jgi:thiamine-monophosphate kinase
MSQADRLLVDVFLVGDVDRREVVRRGPGQPGDRLFVTGWPGESGAGFHLLQREDEGLLDRHRHLVQRHQNPTPRLAAGRAVATSGAATAMIDLSDGLASDLRHLTLPYGLGAEIEGIRFPFSSELRLCVEELSLDPLELALTGGEDYELLFALDSAKADTVLEGIRSASHCPVTEIGRLTDRTGELKLVESDGRVRALRGGWDHFGRDQQTNRDEP